MGAKPSDVHLDAIGFDEKARAAKQSSDSLAKTHFLTGLAISEFDASMAEFNFATVDGIKVRVNGLNQTNKYKINSTLCKILVV